MFTKWIALAGLIGAGIIHLLPVWGVTGAAALEELCGIRSPDPDLQILLRHRALLFGVLGVLMIAAAFKQDWQLPALAAGLASTLGFVFIAHHTGGFSPAIARVVSADIVAIVLLCLSATAVWLRR